MNHKPDFIADLHYLTTEQGGRKTPVFSSGYRPQIKFSFSDMQTSGQQKFIDKDEVFPGGMVTAEITLLSSEFCHNRLKVGFNFEFKEASRIIGTGKIIEILNKELIAE